MVPIVSRIGRPKAELALTVHEHEILQMLVQTPSIDPRIAARSRAILECSKGLADQKVAHQIGVGAYTIGKWRRRFIKYRIPGIYSPSSSVSQPTLSGRVLVLTDRERAELLIISESDSVPHAIALRCRVLLACDSGLADREAAQINGIAEHMAGQWRQEFTACRPTGIPNSNEFE